MTSSIGVPPSAFNPRNFHRAPPQFALPVPQPEPGHPLARGHHIVQRNDTDDQRVFIRNDRGNLRPPFPETFSASEGSAAYPAQSGIANLRRYSAPYFEVRQHAIQQIFGVYIADDVVDIFITHQNFEGADVRRPFSSSFCSSSCGSNQMILSRDVARRRYGAGFKFKHIFNQFKSLLLCARRPPTPASHHCVNIIQK